MDRPRRSKFLGFSLMKHRGMVRIRLAIKTGGRVKDREMKSLGLPEWRSRRLANARRGWWRMAHSLEAFSLPPSPASPVAKSEAVKGRAKRCVPGIGSSYRTENLERGLVANLP